MLWTIFSNLPVTAQKGTNLFSLISEATLIGKLVMFILMIFSIVSWAIIIFKLVEYTSARKNSTGFMDYFRQNKNFNEISKYAASLKNNPIAQIFRYGYKEIYLQMNKQVPPNQNETIDLESINRSLLRASNSEITRLERLNGFLATTANVTPFIGLFGTVWGIMTSFHDIGVQMNANLATVAPGIADALIATALGLFTAIPAVIFYNLLVNKMKVIVSLMEDFTLEFLNVSQKIN
jgi:biopolymer transport protein TolQ